MAFTDAATLAVDATFASRVRVAVIKSAHAVLGETWTGNKARLLKRAELARRVLSEDQATIAARCAWSVVTNGAITGASSDSDIEFTVNSMWDDWAGVLTPEQ